MHHDAENYLLMYQSAQDYLKLSRVHAAYLGGLRWSAQEDALVAEDNRAFAFSEAIAEFVEGFASQGRVVAFGYLLHWMDLLQNQRRLATPAIQRLAKTFAEAGSNWRFAGAFAATLSEDVPEVPDPPDLASVGKRLRNRAFPIRWFTSQFHETRYPPEHPPIAPETFEENVVRKLEAYSEGDLRIWLHTGRGPIRNAERLAEEPPMPRSLARVLASLVERPRLSGAQTYVTQLVGALTLPPRRFVPQELPVGGYSDIVTRGQVEHLLPTQFALDELEFLRRFAEKELLYFRREEPPAQNRQELVVLLDQGVRTWGDVRLVLSAAALAFGKQAILRKTPFFLATTSNHGHVLEPTYADEETLGQLVEASDLSLNPGLALEQTLETPSEALRDVVLLTHPRSLREEDVLSAARRLDPRDRLFAVALDGHGQVEVSEIRRGTPIKVRQFHIDFAPSQPKRRRRYHSGRAAPGTPWSGDVETIPFPFRLGTEPHVAHFDFDYAGGWLLTVSGQNSLHLWKLDGTAQEMLPRPCREQGMKQVFGIIGVSGGFVVAGKINEQLVLARYDVVRRQCKLYDFAGPQPFHDLGLGYMPERHCVTMSGFDIRAKFVVELSTERQYLMPEIDVSASQPVETGHRERDEAGHSLAREVCIVYQNPTSAKTHQMEQGSYCVFDAHQGTLEFHRRNEVSRLFTPMADGKSCFLSIRSEAQAAGNTLALRAERRYIGDSVTLMECANGAILREYAIVRANHKIARHLLSLDGGRIALLRSDHRVEVDPVSDRGLARMWTRVGGFATEARLYAGKNCVMLNLGARGQFWHFFDWKSGKLEHHYERTRIPPGHLDATTATLPFPAFLAGSTLTAGEARPWPKCCTQDLERYKSAVKRKLWFVLDRFGQVAVLDESEQVLAMFIAFRDRHAAWMPDGTRFGSLTLSLGPVTPGAAQKIGQTLLRAEEGGER